MSAVNQRDFRLLQSQIEACCCCPRLTSYRQEVAAAKRRSFADWNYWGRPVAGFGDPAARIWIIGLAPAAHGANRTGRVFTGDRSGDFLFASLYRCGLANQPTSLHRDDGLQLTDCFISATVRCAPPDNKPLPTEVANCSAYLDREWELLNRKRVILAMGSIAWNAAISLAARHGCVIGSPRPKFGHASQTQLNDRTTLIGSYHVSQQNTFTGRLTPAMFDAVIERCKEPAVWLRRPRRRFSRARTAKVTQASQLPNVIPAVATAQPVAKSSSARGSGDPTAHLNS